MSRANITVLFVIALAAVSFSFIASSHPDGLERVAQDLGFISRQEGKEIFKSPVADYVFPGIKNTAVSSALAGLAGIFLIFIGINLFSFFKKK